MFMLLRSRGNFYYSPTSELVEVNIFPKTLSLDVSTQGASTYTETGVGFFEHLRQFTRNS